MTSQKIVIIGAGGHGAVVAATAMAAGHEVIGFFDDNPDSWRKVVLGLPVLGPVSQISSNRYSHAIIGIGSNEARKQIAQLVNLEWTTVVHPFAWVHPGTSLGVGTVVCAGAIVQPGAVVGSHVILNTKASVDHHCRVGDFAHIAVAHLAGGASMGEGAFLALGSVALPGIHIGDWAIVGAGAVVTKDVAPSTTVVGTPARPIKPRSPHH